MKDHPMLFKGEMVRAIMRRPSLRLPPKRETRRLMDPQPMQLPGETAGQRASRVLNAAPWQPGDRLWVKETWRPRFANYANGCAREVRVRYQADDVEECFALPTVPWKMPAAAATGNASPLFMPRWASRLTLKIRTLRFERLQEITEEDARLEGVEPYSNKVGCPCEDEAEDPGPHIDECAWKYPDIDPDCEPFRASFALLWDRINGKRASWASNPYVYVIGFRRVAQRRLAAGRKAA